MARKLKENSGKHQGNIRELLELHFYLKFKKIQQNSRKFKKIQHSIGRIVVRIELVLLMPEDKSRLIEGG